MAARLKNLIKGHPLIAFFVQAYAFTWLGSLLYLFAAPGEMHNLPPFLALPGAVVWYYGPFLAAVIVTGVSGNRGNLRRLLSGLRIWRVGWRWYAFILLYPLALHLAVVGLDRLLGGPAPVFFQAEGVPTGNVWLILFGLVLYQVLVRGIGEEVGWRGFALSHLQSRWNSLTASLILGLLWAMWHFHPANFSVLLSIGGVFIFLNITATTFIFTWVYNQTRGSVLMAALFHMTLNVAEYVVPIGLAGAGLTRLTVQIALLGMTVIALVLSFGSHLGKGK